MCNAILKIPKPSIKSFRDLKSGCASFCRGGRSITRSRKNYGPAEDREKKRTGTGTREGPKAEASRRGYALGARRRRTGRRE